MATLAETTVRRVLIYRLGSLGDHVVALPCLHLVARVYPAAERRLLTNIPVSAKAPAAAAVLAGSGLVHGFYRYVMATRNPLHLLWLWLQIAWWRPQVLVYLAGARGLAVCHRDSRFFRLCGIPTQLGLPSTDAMQQNLPVPNSGLYEAESERLARTLRVLGDAHLDQPESWNLHLSEAEQAYAATALTPAHDLPLIALSIGTKRQCNDWGLDNWQQLATRLGHEFPHHALILTGAADEYAASETVAERWRATNSHPAINLCGLLTPRQSAAALARAQVFLGHDSGPMHLAAAVQTPCVAIFAARQKPGVWFPYGPRHRVIYHQVECWNCGLEVCTVQKKKCITSISIDEVFGHVRHLLQG